MNDDATRLADWVRNLRELAHRANNKEVLERVDLEVNAFRRDAIHLVFAGGPNCGKSTRINALVGRNALPVSPKRSTEGVSVHNNGIDILERPPLDAVDDDTGALIASTLRSADVVVLVINALMPVTRVDAALLTECARRELPLVLVLSKFDHLSDEERATVVDYVQKHVSGTGLELPLIATGTTEGMDAMRQAIEATLASTDFARVRRHQAKEALLDLLSALELAAHGGVEAQALSDTERAAEIHKKEQKLEAQTLTWMQIEQRLALRRQKVEEQMRDHLATNRASALESLAFDLERASDVNRWWTEDLPHRLSGTVRNVATQVSSSISRQVTSDVRWLHEELHRQFKFPLAAPFVEPEMDVDAVGVVPTNVALANMQTLRVVSRVGTAATVVLAGIALAHTGIAGATLAISSLGGLGAEWLANRVAAKDRTAVRGELDRVLQRAWLDLAVQVSAKLKSGYDDLVAALKREQERWHESQLQALRTAAPVAAATDWQSILEQTQMLATEVATNGAAS